MNALEMLAEYYQDLLHASGGRARPEEIEVNMRVLVGRYCHRVANEDAGKIYFCYGYSAPHFWWSENDPENYQLPQNFISRCSEHPERRAETPPSDQFQRAKTAIA